MVFGETNVKPLAHPPALSRCSCTWDWRCMLGLYIPPYLDAWYRQAARDGGGLNACAWPTLGLDYRPLAGALPAAVCVVDEAQWSAAAEAFAIAGARLVALWGSDRRDLGADWSCSPPMPQSTGWPGVRLRVAGDPPSLSRRFVAFSRSRRACSARWPTCSASRAHGAEDERPWLRPRRLAG